MGALGFNTLRAARDWPDTLLKRLQLVAQVFANALARRRHELSLRESDQRLALAADSAEAGLWTLDYDSGLFWATERARAIFGYSPGEGVTTDSLKASVHPEDWGVVRGAIERSRSTGEPLDVEYRIAAPGASRPRWISSRGRPVRDPDGRVTRLTGISFDVTGRKLAEQESSERLEFETLIADLSSRFINLPAGDVDREIEHAQRRVCEVLGIDLSALWQGTAAGGTPLTLTHFYAAEEGLLPPMRGMSAEELFPWLQAEMLAGRAVCVSSLEGLPPEAALDRDNLRRFGVRSNLTLPLSVGGASTVAALGFNSTRSEREWPESLVKRLRLVGQVFANALARKRAEEALGAGRDRLEAATDLAGLAFYEVDFAAQTVFVDDGFRRLTGLPPEREAGLGPVHFWVEQLHAEDRDHILERRRQMHEGDAGAAEHGVPLPPPHPRGGVAPPRDPRSAARRDGPGGPDLRRPARHHGEAESRGGPAAVTRGDRAAEGPPPGGERLPQGRDPGRPSRRRRHRSKPRHPEGPAPRGAGRAHGFLRAHSRRDRHRKGARRPRPPPAERPPGPPVGQGQLRRPARAGSWRASCSATRRARSPAP